MEKQELVIAILKHRRLIDESLLISGTISLVSMLLVLGAFFLIAGWNTVSGLQNQATTTADEIADILIEPLYNIDDTQAIRIAGALLSSGRISGLRLESQISGLIFD